MSNNDRLAGLGTMTTQPLYKCALFFNIIVIIATRELIW